MSAGAEVPGRRDGPPGGGDTSVEALREVVGRLAAAASALSALGAALGGVPVPPAARAALDGVLAALGVRLDDLPAAAVRPLLGEIRYTLFHATARLRQGHPGRWAPTDREVLQAAGDVSAGFPGLLQRSLPQLPGLQLDREGARFLDVGVGVAALSIEMARRWPGLRVVGIDPFAPALALAHENVQAAGLQARVELRQQAVEDLPDEGTFDLAWCPSGFIPAAAIPAALRRLRGALRPGGWLIFATLNPGDDSLTAALSRLRTLEWGGYPFTPAEAAEQLQRSGFAELDALPAPPAGVARFLVARG